MLTLSFSSRALEAIIGKTDCLGHRRPGLHPELRPGNVDVCLNLGKICGRLNRRLQIRVREPGDGGPVLPDPNRKIIRIHHLSPIHAHQNLIMLEPYKHLPRLQLFGSRIQNHYLQSREKKVEEILICFFH